MPVISVIKATDAPAPSQNMSKGSHRLITAISSLKKDEALRLTPDPGKSMRGLKTAVGRVASRNGLTIESWTDEVQNQLFVRKV